MDNKKLKHILFAMLTYSWDDFWKIFLFGDFVSTNKHHWRNNCCKEEVKRSFLHDLIKLNCEYNLIRHQIYLQTWESQLWIDKALIVNPNLGKIKITNK